MNKKINSKKVVSLAVSILVMAGFIILIACNSSHSKVFKLQKGEAESLGVVFPEEGSPYESYSQLYLKYRNNKEYEKAIVAAKKMLEISPTSEKRDDYYELRSCYVELGRYNEAIEVDKKIWTLKSSIDDRDVLSRVFLLDEAGKPEEISKTLKKYRKLFPNNAGIDELIKKAEQAVTTREKIFPESKTTK